MLTKYGDLDTVLAHAEEVPGTKRRQNLVNHREDALVSRTLARLDVGVPVSPDWQAARIGGVDHARLKSLFQDFGFRSLAQRAAELDGFGRGDQPQVKLEGNYHIVDSFESLDKLVEELSEQTLISVDTETTAISPRYAQIVGYALAHKSGEGYYVAGAGDRRERRSSTKKS